MNQDSFTCISNLVKLRNAKLIIQGLTVTTPISNPLQTDLISLIDKEIHNLERLLGKRKDTAGLSLSPTHKKWAKRNRG